MTVSHVQSERAPWELSTGSRRLLGWICTSNPFYVLSALLVCLGLWLSFGSQADAYETWALLFGMAVYTLLLAVTACLLVRFVAVWDDIRTVLLLVVLMLLATSVTFDDVLARGLTRGILCYVGGFLFSVAVSEGILRVIRLRLPALYRVPYYLVLALFFLYPIALVPLLKRPASESLAWCLFGFSPAAGLLFLTLLPAIRRRRRYVADNGSPWRWAWYPWTLFGVLGFGVVARAALLCWSMHPVHAADSEPYIFGLYFLVPFGLAIFALVLEIGLVEDRPRVIQVALLIPVTLVFLSGAGHRADPLYQWFLERFTLRLGGTPLFLTLLASAACYIYAALRRAPVALDALTAVLLALAIVAPQSLDLNTLVPPQSLPVLGAALAQTAIGLRRKNAWRCLVGAGLFIVSATLLRRPIGAAGYQVPILFHLTLAAVLLVGAAFHDRVGRFLRTAGAVMALLGAVAWATGRMDHAATIPYGVVALYPLAMSVLIAAYGVMLGNRASLACAGLILCCWLAAMGCRGYWSLRSVAPGLDYIVLGLAVFSLAVLTSMAKGGVLPWRITGRSSKVTHAPD
jgi:hypothetical protein